MADCYFRDGRHLIGLGHEHDNPRSISHLPDPERQRRCIIQPRVDRVSDLPWILVSQAFTTLKALHHRRSATPANPGARPHCTRQAVLTSRLPLTRDALVKITIKIY